MGSRQSKNDYENTQTEGLFPAVSVSSKSAFDTDFNYDSSTLTEKQEIVLLRGRVAEQKKELESKNEVVTALQRNFEALSMFLKKERAERDFLKNQYEKIKEENMKFIEKITNLTDKIKILSADNELLAKDRVRAKHLAEENDQLLVQIKGLESQITSLNNVNKRVSELLEKSQSDLDKLRRDYKIESEKVTSVTQKLNELTKVMEDTIKQLKHEHISELDAQKKESKAVIDELKDTLAKFKVSSTKEQENLISEIQQLRLKNKEIESELDSFRAQFSQKDLQSKSDSNKNSELLDQINSFKEMLKSERYSFNLEKDELQNKLAELTKNKNELKQQNGELSLRLKQLSEDGLNKDSLMNKNFESQERNIQKLNSIVVSLNKEIEEYKSVVEKLKLTNSTQKWDHEAEMKSQASAFLAQLEDKDSIIKIKESKIEELQMELRVMGQKFANSNKENNSSERELQIKDAEILKLKNEISSLTKRIKAMLGEIDSKEHQISEKEKLIENENSEHQKKWQNYESEINHINDELLRQKQMYDEMTKGEDILKQLENEIFNIKQKHADELKKLKATIEKEVRLKIAVEKKYKEQLESLEKQISSLNKEVQTKLEDIEKINKELDRQKWYNSSFKEDLEKNKDAINSITKENSELKQQLDKYWIELAECKAKLQNIPDINIEDIQMKEKIAKMKEAKISSLLMKLDNVMSSMESNMSCYLCMDVFNNPITLNPWGHNFCREWYNKQKPDKCPKCESRITSTLSDEVIDDLVAKYLFERDILAAFKNEDIWKNLATIH